MDVLGDAGQEREEAGGGGRVSQVQRPCWAEAGIEAGVRAQGVEERETDE